jgi:hypothetical protein
MQNPIFEIFWNIFRTAYFYAQKVAWNDLRVISRTFFEIILRFENEDQDSLKSNLENKFFGLGCLRFLRFESADSIKSCKSLKLTYFILKKVWNFGSQRCETLNFVILCARHIFMRKKVRGLIFGVISESFLKVIFFIYFLRYSDEFSRILSICTFSLW